MQTRFSKALDALVATNVLKNHWSLGYRPKEVTMGQVDEEAKESEAPAEVESDDEERVEDTQEEDENNEE